MPDKFRFIVQCCVCNSNTKEFRESAFYLEKSYICSSCRQYGATPSSRARKEARVSVVCARCGSSQNRKAVNVLYTPSPLVCKQCIKQKEMEIKMQNLSPEDTDEAQTPSIQKLLAEKGRNQVRLGHSKTRPHIGEKQCIRTLTHSQSQTAQRKIVRTIVVPSRGITKVPINLPFILQPGSDALLRLEFASDFEGELNQLIIFQFQGFMQGVLLKMNRVADTQMYERLKPVAPFQPKQRQQRQAPRRDIEAGVKPTGVPNKYVRMLPWFGVPGELREVYEETDAKALSKVLEDLLSRYLYPTLSSANHAHKFRRLLWLEELKLEDDIGQYSLQGVTFQKAKGRGGVMISVPGLAEKRPSVLRGDKVYATRLSDRREFEGYTHEVELNAIRVVFGPKFHGEFVEGQKYDVRFTISRTPMRRQHRALEDVSDELLRMIFPTETLASPNIVPMAMRRIDPLLNTEQMTAVSQILMKSSGELPYIVFGPPGTGKTKTLVEAISQIVDSSRDTRILVTAPSNNAADIFIDRLRGRIPPREMFRLNAYQRTLKSCPEWLSTYSFQGSEGFEPPEVEQLKKYKVVVCTCISAAMIRDLGVEPGHFTHVFIDEAAQATEPEALVALSVATLNTQVVLAGDHKQLGPIIHSAVALKFRLDKSLLERLIECEVFSSPVASSRSSPSDRAPVSPGEAEGEILARVYDLKYVTKLVRNYRSHKAILALPSKLFYDSDLQPCGDPALVESLCGFDLLPNKRQFPFWFCGIQGKDERESTSPSFFNRAEVVKVIDIVKQLLDYKKTKIQPSDIGIITPYNKQVQKIKAELPQAAKSSATRDGVLVGSTEVFQGLERRVIIISCVRSNADLLPYDYKHRLGFLKNPKRFNVAITRTQALLIVVGNPFVLCHDRCWRELIGYAQANGGYSGIQFTPGAPTGTEEFDDLVREMDQHEVDMEMAHEPEAGINRQEP